MADVLAEIQEFKDGIARMDYVLGKERPGLMVPAEDMRALCNGLSKTMGLAADEITRLRADLQRIRELTSEHDFRAAPSILDEVEMIANRDVTKVGGET